jgi:hypothetical protein
MFREIFFYDVLVLNMIFLNIYHCPLTHLILSWSPGKGGSKSKTRRPEFHSSEVGNPILCMIYVACKYWHF